MTWLDFSIFPNLVFLFPISQTIPKNSSIFSIQNPKAKKWVAVKTATYYCVVTAIPARIFPPSLVHVSKWLADCSQSRAVAVFAFHNLLLVAKDQLHVNILAILVKLWYTQTLINVVHFLEEQYSSCFQMPKAMENTVALSS